MDSTATIIAIAGLIVTIIATYIAFKQYKVQSKKEKDIIVNFNPEIKIHPEIKIPDNKDYQEDSTFKMDEDYYVDLAARILSSKKPKDSFDISETK